MKLLNNKIGLYAILVLAILTSSCVNEAEEPPRELDARFIAEISARTISFINASNDATSYSWDFGNGTSSQAIDPEVVFDNGTFTVVLTAFDDDGNSDTFEETFTIDCETTENIDPANGNLNWTFLTADESTTFDAFGNTAGFIVTNPVEDAVNPSCNVQRFEKTPGCFTFAGLGTELETAMDFNDPNTSKIFTMKVLAETQVTDVTLRIERLPFPNFAPAFDRVATISQVGQWEELTFDFTGVTGTFKSMIIYFERNAECDGDVYYFDDIIQQ